MLMPMKPEICKPAALLANLSPAQFMRQYWQKKPLLVRQAIPGFEPLLSPEQLFALAADDAVESRLLQREGQSWTLDYGPFEADCIPAPDQANWTLLVQGVDLHHPAVHALMQRFRFVPDARLDDVMISYASDGGGVGPHFDSYDVFLLQAQGQRRWRIGQQPDRRLVPGLPLKILQAFVPEQEFVLQAGDMLYLPPGWAHDGLAQGGDCMTYSIGFRQPERRELAAQLLQRLSDEVEQAVAGGHYQDPQQAATADPAAIPEKMQFFARDALAAVLQKEDWLDIALGCYLTEPKAQVFFQARQEPSSLPDMLTLDMRTRMMHDRRHVFINGEVVMAQAQDFEPLRQLANARCLDKTHWRDMSAAGQQALLHWLAAGWLHAKNLDLD